MAGSPRGAHLASIRVELVEGRGEYVWPRPGRVFAAARSHSFALLARAIDTAFARWDLSHLHQFRLANGTVIGMAATDPLPDELDDATTRLSRLQPGEQFTYEFDFGDGWAHLCTVGEQKIDPLNELGILPTVPLPYWGGGAMPDQYGRRWMEDGGGTKGTNPNARDLPPIHPGWGRPA